MMPPPGVDKSIVWYLAGPMSGIKGFNYPYFDEIAKRLRANGYSIVSPAEMDPPENRRIMLASPDGGLCTLPAGTTWGKLMARDIPTVTDDCGGIILLPNWWKSRGARLEVTCGLLCDKQFAVWGPYSETVRVAAPVEIATRLNFWLSGFQR